MLTHQVGRAGERVRLAASGLSVAEGGAREPLDGHLQQARYAAVLQHVLLGGGGLEHRIVAEQLGLLARRAAQNLPSTGELHHGAFAALALTSV